MIAHSDNEPKALPVVAKRKGKSGPAAALIAKINAKEQELGENEQKTRLTRKQLAVLNVIMDPDNAGKGTLELCRIAGVSTTAYYHALRHPGVQEERQRMCKELITSKVAPIIQRSIKVAMTEGRDGFQDRRLLLSMSGDYVERQRHEHQVDARVVVGVVGVSMDEL